MATMSTLKAASSSNLRTEEFVWNFNKDLVKLARFVLQLKATQVSVKKVFFSLKYVMFDLGIRLSMMLLTLFLFFAQILRKLSVKLFYKN